MSEKTKFKNHLNTGVISGSEPSLTPLNAKESNPVQNIAKESMNIKRHGES
jgi:hypothetical protein